MTLTEALAKLHAAERIKHRWLAGMLHKVMPDQHFRADDANDSDYTNCDPVLDDPATVGCLVALLREATGDPHAHVQPLPSGAWLVHFSGTLTRHEVALEGEALSAAIIALAETTP